MKNKSIDANNPIEIAKLLSDFVNGACRDDIRTFIDAVMVDHPTLLQKKLGIAFGLIAEAARCYEMKRGVDGRNEYSFRLAREIMNKLETKNNNGKYHRLKIGMPLI